MRSTSIFILATALATAVAALAHAAPPPADWDDRQEDDKSFWSKVSHPHHATWVTLVARGVQLVEQQNYREAAPVLVEATTLEPTEPLAFYWLTRSYQELARWSDCADSVTTLLRLRPDFTPPDQKTPGSIEDMAGICLSVAGRPEEAIPHYQRLLSMNLRDAQGIGTAHWNLGDCYLALGRLDSAIEQYTLGIAANPQESMLHFALGVAFDRDEQISHARDEIAQGLHLDPQLHRVGDPHVFYVPEADKDYYYAFAYQVGSELEAPTGDLLRRGLALAYFRKYLFGSSDGPWAPRARDHLAELGSTALGDGEISVLPDVPEKGAIVKSLVGAGPELQKCLEGSPLAVLRASIVLTPPKAPSKPVLTTPPVKANPYKPPPPQVRVLTPNPPPQDSLIVASVGPVAPPPEARGCVEQKVRSLKLTVTQPTRITVIVFAR